MKKEESFVDELVAVAKEHARKRIAIEKQLLISEAIKEIEKAAPEYDHEENPGMQIEVSEVIEILTHLGESHD